MELFPYQPREHQADFVESVERVMRKGGHIVLESGTGTGKTICALTAAVQTALAQGKKVVYLTRTNSQQRQVLLELRRLNEKRQVFGMGVQGRQSTCPLFRRDPDLKEGSSEELSKLCADKKKRTLAGKDGGCRFYEKVLSTNFQEIEAHCHQTLPTVEEFVSYCDSRDLCAYELSKELMENATVITAPYPYLFVPFIRRAFLENLNAVESDLMVIIDEAHNLPDYAREIRSAEMSRRFLALVRKEADDYGDPEVLGGVSILDVVSELEKLLTEALDEYLIDDDGLIPPGFLQEGLLQAFTTTSRSLKIAANALMTHGEIIRESKQEQGRLPRSYIFSLGALLNFWLNLDEEFYVRLVVGGENPRFEASCLDPSLACTFFGDCHASLHMSGTLAPLYEYRDSIGLPKDAVMRTFPSPFPKGNRTVLYLEDVTTKFEEMALDQEILERMIEHTVGLCNVIDRNTVVFFPSYSLMDRFLQDGVVLRIRKPVLMEERGMPQAELMDTVSRFKQTSVKGSVLFAVMGGRISEGIDFPDKELEMAIIVGIPFPKPTAKHRALLHYYEMKFGKGWEYTVKVPAARKMMQAIGRLIRNENDIGAAVILDKRAKQFADRIDLKDSQSVQNDVLNFFRDRGR
jgi:DNA excision repair protein ERCC-2